MTMNGSNTNLVQWRISMMLLCWYCLLSITNASNYEECTIVTEIDSDTPWTDYTIAATGNYSIAPICRCSIGKPFWEYYSKDGNKFEKLETQNECRDNGQQCNQMVILAASPSLYIYATLNNYVATETTTLYCRNTQNNYAPAISIVITQDCPDTTNSSSVNDDSLTSSTVLTSSVVSPSQTQVSSPSPSPFSMSTITPSISTSQSTQVAITTNTTSTNIMDSSIAGTVQPSSHFIITSTIYITTTTLIRDMCSTTTTTTTTQAATTNRITQNNVGSIEGDLNDYKMVSYVLVAVVCVSMILVIILSILLLIVTVKKKNNVACIDTIIDNKEDASMAYNESIKKHNEYVINT